MSAINLSKVTVNLSKGEKVNLSKASNNLNKIMVALGWDPVEPEVETVVEKVKPGFFAKLFGAQEKEVTRQIRVSKSTEDYDLDAWIALERKGKIERIQDVVYYGNLAFYDDDNILIIKHHGDNLTGQGAANSDKEQITFNLEHIPSKYDKILVAVTIYRGKERHQSFGIVKNTFVRVVDMNDNFEICRYSQADMSDNPDAISFIAGEFCREGGTWQFKAIGECTKDGSITDVIARYQ